MNSIRDMSEDKLICKTFAIFFIPLLSFAGLSMFYPYVYAFMPAHESTFCVCSFYHQIWLHNQDPNSGHTYKFLNDKSDYAVLESINSASFYIVNWFALIAIVVMIYRIRHATDETLIKRECFIIVIVWVFFSILQFTMFFWGQLSDCHKDSPMTKIIDHTY